MFASVIGLVLFLLSKLFNVVKVANLSLALSALLIIISLILGICFLNTEYEVLGGLSSSAYGKIYAMSFWGLILGTISSIVSWALNLIVLNNNKSKKKK